MLWWCGGCRLPVAGCRLPRNQPLTGSDLKPSTEFFTLEMNWEPFELSPGRSRLIINNDCPAYAFNLFVCTGNYNSNVATTIILLMYVPYSIVAYTTTVHSSLKYERLSSERILTPGELSVLDPHPKNWPNNDVALKKRR